MKRIIIISVFLIAGLFIDSKIFCFSKDTDILSKRPQEDKYCFDFAGVVPVEVVREINTQGEGLKRHFDIDFVVVVIPSLEVNTISEYAVDLFSKWQIGKDTQGKKGILILIAMREQQIKIEVGYDLEQIYTDMYVGQVEREMLKEFLEQADWERGFLATIENFVERTYHMQKKGVDVKEVSSSQETDYSGGAGARNVFDFGAALKKPLPPTPEEVREYFGAQPTPQLAFERYMEFCAKNMSDYTIDLFSDLTKYFYSHWPTSSGQRRSEAEQCSAKPYIVKVKDNHAVIIFPDADLDVLKQYAPYFILKTEKGWQMDLNTMTRVLHYGGGLCVHWQGNTHPYIELVMDEYNLDDKFTLVPKSHDIGYYGFYYLGDGLFDPREPGVHIAMWGEEQSKKVGLKKGDSILAIDGQKVNHYNDVTRKLLENVRVGDVHHVEILRNGQRMGLNITAIGLKDAFEDFKKCLKVPRVWLGIYMAMTTEVEQNYAHTYCAILEVYPGSPVDKAGLKPGDIILALNEKGNDIYVYDIIKLLDQLRPGEIVRMKVLRDLKEKKDITVIAEETSQKGYF